MVISEQHIYECYIEGWLFGFHQKLEFLKKKKEGVTAKYEVSHSVLQFVTE